MMGDRPLTTELKKNLSVQTKFSLETMESMHKTNAKRTIDDFWDSFTRGECNRRIRRVQHRFLGRFERWHYLG